MLRAALLALTLGLRLDDVDGNLVEALRDAQTTNRDAWSRGRARVLLTVTTPDVAAPCVVKGEILWHNDFFVLKTQVSDPLDVYFAQSRQFDEEGNFIARGQGFFITYSAGQGGLRDQDWAPRTSSVAPIFVLSPRVRFGYCCPPHSDPGRPWNDLIGPFPNLPDVFKSSKFTHRALSGGDIEQVRRDEDGHKVIIVFSAKYDMAVASVISYDPQGTVLLRCDYTYTRQGAQGLLPVRCVVDWLNTRTRKIYRYDYAYSDMVMPDATPPSAFTRAAVLDRIRRETDYGKPRSKAATVSDTTLESLARELREKGTARP